MVMKSDKMPRQLCFTFSLNPHNFIVWGILHYWVMTGAHLRSSPFHQSSFLYKINKWILSLYVNFSYSMP